MRKILLILSLLATLFATAQSGSWTNISGNQRFSKGLGIPVKDTFALSRAEDSAQVVIRPADGYMWYVYKGSWKKSLAIDTTSLSNRINLKLNISDTAAMLSGYQRIGTLSSSYIHNQNGSTLASQTAKFKISDTIWTTGAGIVGGNFLVGTTTNSGGYRANFNGTIGVIPTTNGSTDGIVINSGIGASTNYGYSGILAGGSGYTITAASDINLNTTGAITSINFERSNSTLVSIGGSTYVHDVFGTGRYSGNLTAASFIKSGGTSSQFLKADGSTDSNTYLTAADIAGKLNISDTATMLTPYLRKSDTATMLSPYLKTSYNYYIGTTLNALNRASASQTLTGVSIDGNAGTVTNGVYTVGDQTIGGIKTFSSTISGNSNLFINGAASIGYSSTSFTYTLDVNGTGRFASSVNVNGATADANAAMSVKASSGTGQYLMYGRDNSDVLTYSLKSDGSANFNGLVTASGGLSSTTGTFTGQLNGANAIFTGSTSNYLRVAKSSGTPNYLQINAGAGATSLEVGDISSTLGFITGNATRYTIDASGNNTWTGNGSFGGSLSAGAISGTTGTFSGAVEASINDGSNTWAPIIKLTNNSVGANDYEIGKPTVNDLAIKNVNNNYYAIYFQNQGTGANVGIGTVSPRTSFDLNGGVALTKTYTGNNAYNGSRSAVVLDGATTRASFQVNDGTSVILIAESSVPLLFGTGNTEAARFSTANNFLINTTTDDGSNKLQVNGGISSGTIIPSADKSYNIGDPAKRFNDGYFGNVVEVSKDGSGTVGAGPYFSLGNAARNRFMIQQLNASNGIDYWYYNGSSWGSPIITFTNAGAATFASTVTAVSFSESSDLRQKTVHTTIVSLDGVDAIQYTFNPNKTEKWGYGAQQVQKVLPYAVSEGSDGFLKVDYTTVHTYKIAQLEKRIAELEKLLQK